MSLYLRGIGTALPEHSIDQKDAAEKAKALCTSDADQQRLVPVLYRRAGVRTRHSVVLTKSTGVDTASQQFFTPAKDEHDRGPGTAARMLQYEAAAADLACRAGEAALKRAGVASDRFTHLVTVSCSGFSAPGFDVELITRLGLPAATARTHVGFMGCHGMLNGLRVAKAFVEAAPEACVLVAAVELCSLHHQYGWDPEQIVANALFADGAAAVVASGSSSPSSDEPSSHAASHGTWRLVDQASTVISGTRDAMTWRIGDHGFTMTLSPRVPELIRQHLRPWLATWLAMHGLSYADIASWIVHPGGPRILQACQEALPIEPSHLDLSRSVLAELGNMSSPTVLFILERLGVSRATGPAVMLGFGPGLTIEAALLN